MCVQQDVTVFQGYLNCKFSKWQCILKRETDYNTTLHKWYACSLFLDYFFIIHQTRYEFADIAKLTFLSWISRYCVFIDMFSFSKSTPIKSVIPLIISQN